MHVNIIMNLPQILTMIYVDNDCQIIIRANVKHLFPLIKVGEMYFWVGKSQGFCMFFFHRQCQF